nr:uncharacterized protein LOC127297593 [Lolium perenne]
MDVTFREHESFYGPTNDTDIILAPPEVEQEGESEVEGTNVLVSTQGGSLTFDRIPIQGEKDKIQNVDNDSYQGDKDDVIGNSSPPSQGAESPVHEDPGDDFKEIGDLKQHLSQEFEVKDLGMSTKSNASRTERISFL